MTLSGLSPDLFPSLERGERAEWVPILLAPIEGSPERLVIGVAAANSEGFHVEMANQLGRLDCLFGSHAEILKSAVEIAGAGIVEDVAAKGLHAFKDPAFPLESLSFGEPRRGEGENLRSIAQNWMSVLSSLYTAQENAAINPNVSSLEEVAETTGGRPSDRLPNLVLQHVAKRQLDLVHLFADEVQSGKRRMRRNGAISIDFSGRRLVANFSTLKAGKITPAVRQIKTRLWDLKIERDRAFERTDHPPEHELILQVPSADDPQISERQLKNIRTAYQELEGQADEENLRLRGFNSVAKIGDHVILAEAA